MDRKSKNRSRCVLASDKMRPDDRFTASGDCGIVEMRRTLQRSHAWAKYRFKVAPPRVEGPAPVGTPQNMNATKANALLDPIDDPFPLSIRGLGVRPDVPDDQYVDQFYFLNAAVPFNHELTPHGSRSNAFRFRPYAEFNTIGRQSLKAIRENRLKEVHLARMAQTNVTDTPTPATVMQRKIKQVHRRLKEVAPANSERDVGRINGTVIPHDESEDAKLFPFAWRTDDRYEYEVAEVRLKRFSVANDASSAVNSSEVTYKLVLGSHWHHHCKHLAEDICAYLRDIGRQIVQEKLNSVRHELSLCASNACVIDSQTRNAFNSGAATYSDDEIQQFIRRDLELLEQQCVLILSRCASSVAEEQSESLSEPWPTVEDIEPWKRMVEFWTEKGDTTLSNAEQSTRKYEFRKFFRAVTVRLPFHSADFERSLQDLRHWLHRRSSVDLHTCYRKNVVFDASTFKTEHDAVQTRDHTEHGMYSFALDWQQAPHDASRTTVVSQGETFESVAQRLGCASQDLLDVNPGVRNLNAGSTLIVPPNASIRPSSTQRYGRKWVRTESANTWEDAAKELGVEVTDLQAANAAAMATYTDGFSADTQTLNWPVGFGPSDVEFAGTELTFEADTWETIAARLGTSSNDVMTANPDVPNPGRVKEVRVPPSATKRRRLRHPLLRSSEETSELFPALQREVVGRDLPPMFPTEPPAGNKFPGEFGLPAYPVQPEALIGDESWLSYTATYLDKELSAQGIPNPDYSANQSWPFNAVPGTRQQTPFEEDQTLMLSNIPLQRFEVVNPKQHLQDLPEINHEQFAQSVESVRP